MYEPAYVAVDLARFNNWLNANYPKLDVETMKGPREHLYYLIDSHVKHTYAREQVVLPKEHDGLLEIMFSWAERLGVFGGSVVYNAVKSKDRDPQQPLMPIPSQFKLGMQGDMLVLSSAHWSAQIPYYFMIWNIQESDAINGPRTQLVTLSTGAAHHTSNAEHSQATLMLLFGPDSETAGFTEYYARKLGFSLDERPVSDGPLVTYRRHDDTQSLWIEYAAWSATEGHFVVAYMGIDGTYEWNRPHFFDFVRTLRDWPQSRSLPNIGAAAEPRQEGSEGPSPERGMRPAGGLR